MSQQELSYLYLNDEDWKTKVDDTTPLYDWSPKTLTKRANEIILRNFERLSDKLDKINMGKLH